MPSSTARQNTHGSVRRAKERPHPGAQLRFTDVDGCRVTAFATNTPTGQLPDLELRHRRRARAEDRIRTAKDTGLRAFPLQDFTQNQVWLAIVALACEITAWMQLLALRGHEARRWEPKRLRLRLFTVPATLARTARKVVLHLSARTPHCGPTPLPDNPRAPCPIPTSNNNSRTVEPAPTRGGTRAL